MTENGRRVAVGLAVWSMVALAGVAEAAQSKCLVGKNKCVSGLVSGLLKCEQLASTPGKVADPNAKGCVDKALVKFTGGDAPAKGCFGKLEAKTPNDCLTAGDVGVARAEAEACVATWMAAIDPAPRDQTKCGAGKTKCIAGKAAGLLKCWQSAQTPGKDPDPNAKDCVDKVKLKFDDPAKGCFAKLELKAGNDCLPPTGNAADVETLVDACVDATIARLEGGGPATTTTTLATTTTTVATTTSTTTTLVTTTTVPTTTTTIPTTTTTTTSTTTTTTIPAAVTCGAQGVNVTATLVYEPRITGEVFGMFMEVNYPTTVSLPGTGTASTVRARYTNLLGSAYRLTGTDVDTDANGVDDQARALVTAQGSAGIPSAAVERIRFDCTPGATIPTAPFTCTLSSLSDSSGLLFPPEVAALIGCTMEFAPAS